MRVLLIVGTIAIAYLASFEVRSQESTTPMPTTTTPIPETPKPTWKPPPDRDDIADPCSRNDHLTDPKFTCCANKRYEAPSLYTKKEFIDSCLQPRGGEEKIVTTAWHAFKCLADKAVGAEITFENLASALSEKLPDNVKTGINKYIKDLKEQEGGYAPYAENEHLKDFLPYANPWSAYYTAEHHTCNKEGSNKPEQLSENDDSKKCISWIAQTARRGDCCNGIPVPFQLNPDPIVLRYFALKNYTASQIMTLLAPDFNWMNTTTVMYSDNVAACERTSKMILQELITLDDLKAKLDKSTPPNFGEIAELVIPKFMSTDIRGKLKTQMLIIDYNKTLDDDHYIKTLKNYDDSIYKWIYADDWLGKKFNENKTRTLFLTCKANVLIYRQYREIDLSEMCY